MRRCICVSSFIQRHKQDQREENRKIMKDKRIKKQRRDECVHVYLEIDVL